MSGYARRLLTHRTVEFYAVLAVVVVLPFLVLVVLGFVHLSQEGWVGLFVLLLFGLALVTFIAGWVFKRPESEPEELVEGLEPKKDWSIKDKGVWQRATQRIGSMQLVDRPWADVQQQMMAQLVFVAKCYHEGDGEAEYAVSLPEFLLMLEVCSRNYRAMILQHVPLSQSLRLSTLRSAYRKKDKIDTAYSLLQTGYRVFRMVSHAPIAVVSELRGAVLGSMMDGLSDHLQKNLKKLLFEEVSQVAIDLYSGRLKLSDEEIKLYQRQIAPPAEKEPVRPLSVVIIGQVNAGKSSLVNALTEQCLSEIDVLQVGEKITRHRLQLTDDLELDLVDTPGINGEDQMEDLLLREATRGDLVLWLSQANQPAKELDSQLLKRWNVYFSENTQRRKPPILLVTTHNDQLKPIAEWHPPYDLNESGVKKVKNILDALEYTQQAVQLPGDSSAVPVSLAPDKELYNVDTVKDLIIGMSEDARASQLNKDRILAADDQSLASMTWRQLVGIGRVVGTLALKN